MQRLATIDRFAIFIASAAIVTAVICALVPLPEDGGHDHGGATESESRESAPGGETDSGHGDGHQHSH